MKIITNAIGKRFQRDWIFKQLNYTFEAGKTYAVTGPNGSGKSTLLQCLAAVSPLTEGTLQYVSSENQIIAHDDIYRHIGVAAPYLELIEEFTLDELLAFHGKFKKFRISADTLADRMKLARAKNKNIAHFSSGMKQRLKLALALFSDTPIVFLDEPTANMDVHGIDWYKAEIEQHLANRLVIICSNQRYEYDFCDSVLHIADYQPIAKELEATK
jgi:ABC-type multidrug transport system ATPase subunit